MKKKINVLLSTILTATMPISSTSCANKNKKSDVNKTSNNPQADNLHGKREDRLKELYATCYQISLNLKQGIDGSDFTPSQNLADVEVKKTIIEKIKILSGNLKDVKFKPELKGEYFKAGDENYVDVEIVCTKDNLEASLIHKGLQIKNVRQNLEEMVEKAFEDLSKPIDFENSSLLDYDDLQEREIENRFINVLKNKLEHDDERLQIIILNKNGLLLKNHEIDIEIIGKDDTHQITKTMQVMPINLMTTAEYVNKFQKNILISHEYDLFANTKQPYETKSFTTNVKNIFENLNNEILKKRSIEQFILVDSNNNKSNFKLQKGDNHFLLEIKPKFNKQTISTNLALLDVKNHPQYILDEVVKHFKKNEIDLTNEPIFQDSVFNSHEIKIKLEEAIKKQKIQIDDENDIDIKVEKFLSLSGCWVNFSHKNPQIIGKNSILESSFIVVKNVQTSPQKDLDDFISNLTYDINNKKVKIPSELYDLICKFKTEQNGSILLSRQNKDKLNIFVRDALNFSSLSQSGQHDLKINPIEIDKKYDNPNSIAVVYEFKFKKSGVVATERVSISFERQ